MADDKGKDKDKDSNKYNKDTKESSCGEYRCFEQMIFFPREREREREREKEKIRGD